MMMHSRLAVVSFAALALAGIAIAAETTIVAPEKVQKIVEVRDVRVQPDEVSGVLVHAVPGEIPPGGRLPFTYRPDSALPQRSDGSFETSVSVVSFEQVG